jgi:hypothetical protein
MMGVKPSTLRSELREDAIQEFHPDDDRPTEHEEQRGHEGAE